MSATFFRNLSINIDAYEDPEAEFDLNSDVYFEPVEDLPVSFFRQAVEWDPDEGRFVNALA